MSLVFNGDDINSCEEQNTTLCLYIGLYCGFQTDDLSPVDNRFLERIPGKEKYLLDLGQGDLVSFQAVSSLDFQNASINYIGLISIRNISTRYPLSTHNVSILVAIVDFGQLPKLSNCCYSVQAVRPLVRAVTPLYHKCYMFTSPTTAPFIPSTSLNILSVPGESKKVYAFGGLWNKK